MYQAYLYNTEDNPEAKGNIPSLNQVFGPVKAHSLLINLEKPKPWHHAPGVGQYEFLHPVWVLETVLG